MAGVEYNRNNEWIEDHELENFIRCMVARNLRRAEILDFLQRDFPQYAWSLGTLSRRMKHFGIKFIDYNRTVDEVREAFQAEKKGPGQLLGYRTMQKRIREQHGLMFPEVLFTM